MDRKPLTRLSLCVDGGRVLRWRVLRFKRDTLDAPPRVPARAPPGAAFAGWEVLGPGDSLAPKDSVSIVGTVEEPCLTGAKPYVDVCGLVRGVVPTGREACLASPSWRLDASSALDGSLRPFTSDCPATPDLLACLYAGDVHLELALDGPRILGDRVVAILDRVGVRPPPGTAVRGPGLAGLHTTLLVGVDTLITLKSLSATSCFLGLHVRDARRALHLVHALLSRLPQHCRLRVLDEASRADSDGADLPRLYEDLAEALDAELCTVTELLQRGSPSNLAEVEEATDQAAARLRTRV